MARAIDSSYLLQHKRKVKFFGLGPDDESWGYAVPVEVIEKAPTLTQPNEPLTLEELRMIVEPTPVWWDWIQGWVLAKRGMITTWNGRYHNAGSLRGDFYLHPPEGEEEI